MEAPRDYAVEPDAADAADAVGVLEADDHVVVRADVAGREGVDVVFAAATADRLLAGSAADRGNGRTRHHRPGGGFTPTRGADFVA